MILLITIERERMRASEKRTRMSGNYIMESDNFFGGC
jgi:hypothetical protein